MSDYSSVEKYINMVNTFGRHILTLNGPVRIHSPSLLPYVESIIIERPIERQVPNPTGQLPKTTLVEIANPIYIPLSNVEDDSISSQITDGSSPPQVSNSTVQEDSSQSQIHNSTYSVGSTQRPDPAQNPTIEVDSSQTRDLNPIIEVDSNQNTTVAEVASASRSLNSTIASNPSTSHVQHVAETAMPDSSQSNSTIASNSGLENPNFVATSSTSKKLINAWLPLLKTGLPHASKETLLQHNPHFNHLLKAPIINEEIEANLENDELILDKKLQERQDQLGNGLAGISNALSLLIDEHNLPRGVQELYKACKVLADLHYCISCDRKKLIAASFDRSFSDVLEDSVRDETLLGKDVKDRIDLNDIKRAKNIMGEVVITSRQETLLSNVESLERSQVFILNPENSVPSQEVLISNVGNSVPVQETSVSNNENSVPSQEILISNQEILISNQEILISNQEILISNQENSVPIQDTSVSNKENSVSSQII